MNLRQFSIALLISGLPLSTTAQNQIVRFNEGDFIAAGLENDQGETALKVKLSKSGKAKLRKLNKTNS